MKHIKKFWKKTLHGPNYSSLLFLFLVVNRTGQISSVIQIRIYGDNFLCLSVSGFFCSGPSFSALCAYVNGELSCLQSSGKSNAIWTQVLFHFISPGLSGTASKTTCSKQSVSLPFLFCRTCLPVPIHASFLLRDRRQASIRLSTNPT